MKVVIAQCGSEKVDACEAMARDLYTSTYFQKQREYAENATDLWFIQSAEHGLLGPDEWVEPYDTTVNDISDIDAWVAEIADDLERYVRKETPIEILGGRDYADPLTPELERRDYEVHEPLRGLGIGERMAKLDQMAKAAWFE